MIIIGHIGFGKTIDFYIHSFHVPLFFVMSGYLYKDKNLSFIEYTRQKAHSLLLPYICVGLLHYLIKTPYIIYTKESLISPIVNLLFDNSDNLAIVGALWFLTALFFVYMIMFLIRKIIFQILITTAIVVNAYFLSKYFIFPWSLGPALVCFGFMYIGWLVKEKGKIIFSNIYVDLALLIVGFFIAKFNDYVNVRLSQFGNILQFYIAVIFIVFGLQGIIKKIVAFRENYRMAIELQFIGINSLIYMCFNQLIVYIPNKFSVCFSGISLICFKVLELIFALIILRFIATLLSRAKIWSTITGRITKIHEFNKKESCV